MKKDAKEQKVLRSSDLANRHRGIRPVIPTVPPTELPDGSKRKSGLNLLNRLGPLRDGMWSGLPCYIVGGGPSIKDFDFSLLRGQLSIGINRAYEKFDPTLLLGMDARFWGWVECDNFGADARKRFTEYQHGYKLWLRHGEEGYPDDFLTIGSAGEQTFTERLVEGVGDGNNSGFAAINIAYCLGADPIYLLGFDMRGDGNGGQAWFHSGYPTTQADTVYGRFAYNIARFAAPALERAGVTVVNCNVDSALTCFRKAGHGLPNSRLPVVVAYYTVGTGYAEHAKRLEESLRPWGLERHIRGVTGKGSWQSNTQMKTQFLLDMMDQYPGRPLLYLDADATMEEYPRLLLNMPKDCDIAAHMRRGKELLSGTLWLSGSEGCRSILYAWDAENISNRTVWDQRNLQAVLEKIEQHHFYNLPPQYCAIFDSMPEAGEQPVILQWQASRELKGAI